MPVKTKAVSLPSSYRLWRDSLQTINTHKRLLGGVTMVSVLINVLLGLIGDSGVAYQSLWFLFSFAAFTWVLRHSDDAKALPGIRRAYYIGTGASLKLLLVFMFLSLMFIPFSLGAFLYSAIGTVSAGEPSGWWQAIAIASWSLFALFSIYLLARFISAQCKRSR